MTKYFLLATLVFVVWWLWRQAQHKRSGDSSVPAPRAAEHMIQCAHCGVNQPVSESILAGELYYCCAAHQREAEAKRH